MVESIPMQPIRSLALCSFVLAAAMMLPSCRLDRVGTGELVPASDAAADAPQEADLPDHLAPDGLRDTTFEDVGLDTSEARDAAPDAEACVPRTCVDLGASCGTPSDGCGHSLDCGTCTAPQGCHDGRCVVVYHVVSGGTGTADGSSWDNALPTVQAGIDRAGTGDEVWVAAGVFAPPGVATPVITLKDGVAVYGGFAGSEVNRADRDLTSFESVLDGQDQNRVVVGASNATLDGFTIRSGWAADRGGGLLLTDAQNMRVDHCRFLHNYANLVGGGVYLLQSSLSIAHTLFEANNARQGGGVFNDRSTLAVDSCLFYGNSVDNSAGGGGAMFNNNGPTTVINTVFTRNKAAPYFAGAVYNEGDNTYRFVNCTFHENTADLHGGAIFNNVGAKPVVQNCILWGNSPDQIYDSTGAGPADVRYSDVQAGYVGTGNINASPKFEDPLSRRFGLMSGSPCIDAANGSEAPVVDALGRPRVDDPATANTGTGSPGYADMGAFEYQPP